MKTLHYSIIVFTIALVMTGSNVFAQTYPAPNDLGDGNLFNMKATNMRLPGSIMEISGNLVTKDPIKIILSNPNGTIIDSATTFSDRNGDFTSELKMPNDPIEGTWKIIGISGTYYKELNFTIIGNSATETCYGGSLCPKGLQQPVQNNVSACCYMHKINSTILQSPLKQFKSGVAANNIVCRDDLQLLIEKQEGFPICVTLDTASQLSLQDWSYPNNCKYDQDPFTAGVEGLIVIEKNASDPSSGKSYSPRNSTVVIGWNNTVFWINQDDAYSSVTSDNHLFDSGSIKPGDTWQRSFECLGTYRYHSEPHPWMLGVIRVLLHQ